ncbi:hypothetical protein Tco_1318970 [Tanacetum coccineum]
MSNLKFAETHNLVAFLEKPEESDGFEGIIDFLNASSIRYALTVNPTIYSSCIKQFWATAKAKTVNGEVQIQALVDGKKVIITETSVRRSLQLKDAEEPMADETKNVESVPTHSNDPLLSVTTVSATTTTVDELTLAQTLIKIKAARPKVVTIVATTTTTAVTRPKARGVVVQEPTRINAELEEEEMLAKQREEDTNIVEWDNVQAMIDADYELAARL